MPAFPHGGAGHPDGPAAAEGVSVEKDGRDGEGHVVIVCDSWGHSCIVRFGRGTCGRYL